MPIKSFALLALFIPCSSFSAQNIDADLKVADLILSALDSYEISKTDNLLVEVTIPFKSNQHDHIEIKVPFDSDQFRAKKGIFVMDDFLKEINQSITKSLNSQPMNKPATPASDVLCGELPIQSEVAVTLSNCSLGTIKQSFICSAQNKHWKLSNSEQSSVSFVHKCIAPAKKEGE